MSRAHEDEFEIHPIRYSVNGVPGPQLFTGDKMSQEEMVPIKVLEDAQKQIAELKGLVAEYKDEFNKTDAKKDIEQLQYQLKVMEKRELESRTRAEVSEELIEKFFDKMIARMN